MAQTEKPHPSLLLLSNSRNPAGEYLVDALAAIAAFAGQRRKALFFPFAGVTVGWDAYLAMVQQALTPIGLVLTGAHTCADMRRAVAEAELLVVGGGNTFRLLQEMRAHACLSPVREAVRAGTPYIGWSAGAVLASPTICTTNDMPIVNPDGLDALELVPFQINAHYNNALPAGHQGETRNQRIAEYLLLNPHARVVGLPEGNWLQAHGTTFTLHGPHPNMLFLPGKEPASIASGPLVLA